MSMFVNANRLNSFRCRKVIEQENAPDLNRRYQVVCNSNDDVTYAILDRSGNGDLFHNAITLCAGKRGVAIRSAFPVRCISSGEEENVRSLIRALNRRLAIGRLFMEERCVYLTIGVHTAGKGGEGGLFYVRNAIIAVSYMLASMTEAILAAMRGGDVEALAEETAANCENREGIVQAWQVEPPTAAQMPELAVWLSTLEWYSVYE